MTTPFIHEDFLLQNATARALFHTYAEQLPIIDYHCHLSPKDIAEDRRFENLTQMWLEGDHYKWRAMRTCGVDERYITGDANDRGKFERWAETVPKLFRNPLYHWTHLELKRPFGITDRLLNPQTAQSIWEECTEKLTRPEFSTRGILRQMRVEVVCTTDDPVDTLEYHLRMKAKNDNDLLLLPAFRADKALGIDSPGSFLKYVSALSRAADMDIRSFADFLSALRKRHDFFHHCGCRLSDHGLETIYAEDFTDNEVKSIFSNAMRLKMPSPVETLKFKSAMLYYLAVMDWEKEWVQQFHLGALRNNNSRMLHTVGPDTGFDSIGDFEMARSLAKFLNRLDTENELAKTVLYNINPRDNEVFASMAGNFQDGTVAGKMQYGPAWWFLDQIDGMTRQITALSNMGLLSQFVGMATDSRSILSYPRHEYFRRLLCDILGAEMEKGLIPNDVALVGAMVKDICYFNAQRYFDFIRPEGGNKKNGVQASGGQPRSQVDFA